MFHSELSFDRGVGFENPTNRSGGMLKNVPSAHHFDIDFSSSNRTLLRTIKKKMYEKV